MLVDKVVAIFDVEEIAFHASFQSSLEHRRRFAGAPGDGRQSTQTTDGSESRKWNRALSAAWAFAGSPLHESTI
jgi:hypothetical protein